MDLERSPEDITSVVKMVHEFNSFIGQATVPSQNSKRKLYDPFQQQMSNKDYTTLSRNEKADLIVAKSKVAKLEEDIFLKKNEKLNFENELEQWKRHYASSLLNEQEKSDTLRKDFRNIVEQKQAIEEELEELTKNYENLKNKYSHNVKVWDTEKTQLLAKLNQMKSESQQEICELKEKHFRQKSQLTLYKLQCEELEQQLKTFQNRHEESLPLLNEYSNIELKCKQAENKVKELEEKAASIRDSSKFIQNNQSELAKYREIVKENQRLIEDNKLYRDSTENILILHEKIRTLEEKLKRAEKVVQSLSEVELENQSLKTKIRNWESSDVLGGTVKARSPTEFKRIIAELQRTQLSMVEKQSELEMSILIKDSALENKSEEFSKLHEVSMNSQIKNEELEDRYQKLLRELTLVSSDRDGLRRVLASYDENDDNIPHKKKIKEAENTIQTNLEHISHLEEALLTAKQEARSLKNLNFKLQSEHLKMKNDSLESPPVMMERMRTQEAKKEVTDLKIQMEQLQKEKQMLEISLQRLDQQGSCDPVKSRILHVPNNPFHIARQKYLNQFEDVQKENEKLRKKIFQLQSENQEMIDESMNISKLIKSSKPMADISKQLEAEQKSKKRLMEQYGKKAKDFREAIYNLLGYSFKETSLNTYRIQSIYSEKQDDFFLMECMKKEADEIYTTGMIETEYVKEWSSLVKCYLQDGDSIPAFLASVTLELFSRQTKIHD